MNDSEFLDWLCWVWATEGERFYPPEETAEECIAVLKEGDDLTVDDETIASEKAEHYRALSTVIERYSDMERADFDPRGRVERHIEQSGVDLPEIDWSWYDDCDRLGES